MDESSDNVRCTVHDSKFVQPCDALQRTIEPNSKTKGIHVFEYRSIHDGKPTRTIVGIKSGQFDRMYLNFCPFWGERIDRPFSPADSA